MVGNVKEMKERCLRLIGGVVVTESLVDVTKKFG